MVNRSGCSAETAARHNIGGDWVRHFLEVADVCVKTLVKSEIAWGSAEQIVHVHKIQEDGGAAKIFDDVGLCPWRASISRLHA